MIVEGGNCENVISKEAINKIQLTTEKHPSPYRLSYFKKRSEVTVCRRCLVSFSIGDAYFDNIMCDMVPEVDTCHILLGPLGQFERTINDR